MAGEKAGFIFIDKPKDVTSFSCVNAVRNVTKIRRVGFLGTLDPLATGLMIFAVGEATKLITYMEKTDKAYDVTIRLGAVSDTYDRAGNVEERVVGERPELERIKSLISDEFIGECDQVPPIYSAVWIGGKRAYDLARKGKEVVMKSRKVFFHDVKLTSYEWPFLKLSVHCSSGTYIRSLAYDMGQRLGVGGLVEELRRTKIAEYDISESVPLNEINNENLNKYFVPIEKFFSHWKKFELNDDQFLTLTRGGFIENTAKLTGSEPIIALYRDVACATLELWVDGRLKIEKRLNVI